MRIASPRLGRAASVALLRPYALALSSALLLALSIPNEFFRFGFAPLGFVALVPLYFAVLESASYRSAAFAVGLFGASLHALSSYWLWFFNDFRFWTLGTTTITYFIVYYVLGLYLWLFIKKGGVARPALFALLWTVFEYQKSTGFLGYPWGLIPYSLTEVLPLLQIADITGVYGISSILALSNAAIAELIGGVFLGSRSGKELGQPSAALFPGGWRRCSSFLPAIYRIGYAAVAAILVLVATTYGFVRMGAEIPKIGSFEAVLVQMNIDPWGEGGEEASLSTNISLASEAIASSTTKTDIVLFSETSLRRPYNDFRSYFLEHPFARPLIPFIRESGAWLLTGAPIILDWDSYEATNSVILIDPQARQAQDYAKIHPVPFAEAIPFWEYAWFRNFMKTVVGYPGGWKMGESYTVFELPLKGSTLRFGAPICFEDAFAEVCRQYFLAGADVLINLTNDSWSKTVSAEIQHWAAARFRAIESRRTLVRSTNGGFTCVVGPYGEILESLPLFESRALRTEIPVFRESSPTAYLAFGDWYAVAMLLLCGASAIIMMVKDARLPMRRRR